VLAYLAAITVALTGEIDHRPLLPCLRLHSPCTCENLADRREIVVVITIVIIIVLISSPAPEIVIAPCSAQLAAAFSSVVGASSPVAFSS